PPSNRARIIRLRSGDFDSCYKIDNYARVVAATKLDRSNASGGGPEECRLFAMPSRRRADAQGRTKCRARLNRLSRAKSRARPDKRAGAHFAQEHRVMENLRQTPEFKRLAQSRVARVHPLSESRRPARGAAIVRSVSRQDHPQRRSQHDEPR